MDGITVVTLLIQGGEIHLHCPGESNVITGSSNVKRGGEKSEPEQRHPDTGSASITGSGGELAVSAGIWAAPTNSSRY